MVGVGVGGKSFWLMFHGVVFLNGLALDRQNPFSYLMTNATIESPTNSRIKELVKLRESPRRRRERGCFFVEGANDLLALAHAGRQIIEFYFCPSMVERFGESSALEELREMGIPSCETSETVHAKASYKSGGHGIIGVLKTWELGLDVFSVGNDGPLVVLDEVEKPGNLGAILRTVEAFGGAGVILSDPAVDFFNPNVVRSSRGLFGGMPVALGTKADVREWLKNSDRHIVGTSSRAQEIMGNKKFPAGTAFLFGSEKVGLGEFWQDPPDQWVKIGIQGQASSLNLNASVACFLYEYNRMT